MQNGMIRFLKKEEVPLLEEFLYQAIFQKEREKLLPRSIIKDPDLAIYIDAFGTAPDDFCLVFQQEEKVVGAVWSRIFKGKQKGFGSVDEATPELAIAVLPAFRRQGIGTVCFEQMLLLLKSKGYSQVSLSVQKANPAAQWYKKMGFAVIFENGEENRMLLSLGQMDPSFFPLF